MKYVIVMPKHSNVPHKIFHNGTLVCDVHTGYAAALRIRDLLNEECR